MKIEYVLLALFPLAAGHLLWRIRRKGGLRGMMFGAPVRATITEIELEPRGPVKSRLRIHTLGGANDAPRIGVEVVHSSFASWGMVPISLSTMDARRLAEALDQAVRQSGNAAPGAAN